MSARTRPGWRSHHCLGPLLMRRREQWVLGLENVSDVSHCCSSGRQLGSPFYLRCCCGVKSVCVGRNTSPSGPPCCCPQPAGSRSPARPLRTRISSHRPSSPCSDSAFCASFACSGTTPSPASLINPKAPQSPLAWVCKDTC